MAKEPAKPNDKAEEAKPDAAAAAAPPSSKKTFIMVAAVMAIEALAIIGVMSMSGGPDPALALQVEKDKLAKDMQPVELPIAKTRFVNTLKGKVMLYDTEIFVNIESRHKDQVETMLKAKANWLEAEVATVFAKADPVVFQEPGFTTIERLVKSSVIDLFGKDSDDQPILKEVFVKKLIEFSADF